MVTSRWLVCPVGSSEPHYYRDQHTQCSTHASAAAQHARFPNGPGACLRDSRARRRCQLLAMRGTTYDSRIQRRPTELSPATANASSRSSGRLQGCESHNAAILLHEIFVGAGLDSPQIYDLAPSTADEAAWRAGPSPPSRYVNSQAGRHKHGVHRRHHAEFHRHEACLEGEGT